MHWSIESKKQHKDSKFVEPYCLFNPVACQDNSRFYSSTDVSRDPGRVFWGGKTMTDDEQICRLNHGLRYQFCEM